MPKRNRHYPRIPEVVVREPTFHAKKDHIVAVMNLGHIDKIGGEMTVGIRFVSPEHMLEFFSKMMEQAVKVWPDNPWVQEYLSD
jgi:hypothetical protein